MSAGSPSSRANVRPGIIEGFFGRPWPWQCRRDMLDFMARQGLPGYIYAPKDDRWLRREWASPFPGEHLDRLVSLAAHARENHVDFGIGLSPYGLYHDFSEQNRRLLDDKLEQLRTVTPDLLCVLFDDMPGDTPDLATRQVAIMHHIMGRGVAERYLFCPTYYSFDPALETHFGPMPGGYLETLGATLPNEVGIFWTGPRVVSRAYSAEHLQTVGTLLERPPVLWDNYPVNDGKQMVDYLNLRPAPRDTAVIREHCAGHYLNPMNQCCLSRIPVLGMLQQYEASATTTDLLEAACHTVCSPGLADCLIEDCSLFQDEGLSAMSPARKTQLQQRYTTFAGQPCADEVLSWLRGDYAFDPACLT